MLKITRMLKAAYADLYLEIKTSMLIFLVVYEIFLSFRAYNYFMYSFYDIVEEKLHWMEFKCYVAELFIISLVSYIGYKNKQDNENVKTEIT